MSRAKLKLPRQYKRVITELGIQPDLRLTKDGHILIRIDGQLCGKISVGKPEGLRGEKNIIAQIRRTLRGVEQD